MDYPAWAKYEKVSIKTEVIKDAHEKGVTYITPVSNEFHDKPPYPDQPAEMYSLRYIDVNDFEITDGETTVLYQITNRCCGMCHATRKEIR